MNDENRGKRDFNNWLKSKKQKASNSKLSKTISSAKSKIAYAKGVYKAVKKVLPKGKVRSRAKRSRSNDLLGGFNDFGSTPKRKKSNNDLWRF